MCFRKDGFDHWVDIYWGKGKNKTREPGYAAPGVVQGGNNGDIDDAGDSGHGWKWKSEELLSRVWDYLEVGEEEE